MDVFATSIFFIHAIVSSSSLLVLFLCEPFLLSFWIREVHGFFFGGDACIGLAYEGFVVMAMGWVWALHNGEYS